MTARVAIGLEEVRLSDAPRLGWKAARLGELLRAGFPVPAGFVVPARESVEPSALREGLARLGDCSTAVRSSGVDEDGAEESLAGRYETLLEVRGLDAVTAAVTRCRDSGRGVSALVQRLVPADSAGVAFTANPITGNRRECLVSAVRGLGDRLVSGEVSGEEWWVDADGTRAEIRRERGGVIAASQALQVAAMARSAATLFGAPQDVEWAFAGERLHLLQSRPMTGLPDDASWAAPLPGGWLRNFRFGEWLPEPVTLLFESWFLTRAEAVFSEMHLPLFGAAPPLPLHVVVNGWYYHSPFGPHGPWVVLPGLLRRPRRTLALIRMVEDAPGFERIIAAPVAQAWRDEVLPAHRALAISAETVTDSDIPAWIDRIADSTGRYMFSMAMAGGLAWKLQIALARMCGETHQKLLCGLAPPETLPPHAVWSLDWIRAPFERSRDTGGSRRHQELVFARREAEMECRSRFAPRERAKFDSLLSMAQTYALLREEQSAGLTLPWPALRRLVLRLGERLCAAKVIDTPEQVFFLDKSELEAPPVSLSSRAEARRRTWQRQRRLTPPLTIGRVSSVLSKPLEQAVAAIRSGDASGTDAICGMPASPGVATGPVKLVLSADDFDRLRPGEILVAPAIPPAWAQLFDRAAGVVADGGSLAAHATLIAREYGIPTVVGTTDATARLRDGEMVTVDGSAGVVRRVS